MNRQQAKFNRELSRLLDAIKGKCEAQFTYNLEANVPKGIVAIDDAADNALSNGLVSGLGTFFDWHIPDALTLCADLAEDVNAHDEAAQIRGMVTRSYSQIEEVIASGRTIWNSDGTDGPCLICPPPPSKEAA